MTAYYNENNRFAAQWLRNLIAKDLIASGDVDERSILAGFGNAIVPELAARFVMANVGGNRQ